MKTFLEFLNEAKRQKKTPRYKGTPVVVDTHGSHAKDEPQQKLKFQGTPVVVDTHGSHAKDDKPKKLKEDVKWVGGKWVSTPSEERRYVNSGGMPKPGTEYHTQSGWADINDNHHLGDDHQDVHEKLHERYPFDHIRHKHEVHEYTSVSRPLNKHLLASYLIGEHPGNQVYRTHVPSLDKAVNHHELKHDLHVYSGVGFHPGEKAAKDPDNKLFLPAYTSTSIHKGTAVTFADAQEGHTHPYIHRPAKHILHIHLKKGQKGLYVGDHSTHDHEYEFLLPRNTTLRVHPKPSVVENTYGGEQIHVWHAHVVPTETESDKRQLKLDFGDKKKTSAPVERKPSKKEEFTKDDERLLQKLHEPPKTPTPLANKIASHVKKDRNSPF